ncbi:MAG TPA: hypothetical protein V6D17_18195 [Candidatus Obscuribacterales bacterium]
MSARRSKARKGAFFLWLLALLVFTSDAFAIPNADWNRGRGRPPTAPQGRWVRGRFVSQPSSPTRPAVLPGRPAVRPAPPASNARRKVPRPTAPGSPSAVSRGLPGKAKGSPLPLVLVMLGLVPAAILANVGSRMGSVYKPDRRQFGGGSGYDAGKHEEQMRQAEKNARAYHTACSQRQTAIDFAARAEAAASRAYYEKRREYKKSAAEEAQYHANAARAAAQNATSVAMGTTLEVSDAAAQARDAANRAQAAADRAKANAY